MCDSNPCMNNASCISDEGVFVCSCNLGFVGSVCENGLYVYNWNKILITQY